jgi:predicted Zn-dependent protease
VLARLIQVLGLLLLLLFGGAWLGHAQQDPGQRAQIVRRFGGEYHDPILQAYVERVGDRIARAAGRSIRFTVLDSDAVNAFTTGDDEIYVTRGLLAIVANEAELAAVLGHEAGHIVADHATQRSQAVAEANANAMLAAILSGDPESGRALIGFGQQQLASFSQHQELEADEIAIALLRRAGYAPLALAQFLETLGDQAALSARMEGREPQERLNILSTHPVTALRVERAAAVAGGRAGGDGELGRETYLRAIDGMVYGDAPGQGYVRGRSFVHPDLDFRFEVPPGFVLRNGPAQVSATRGDGARIVFDVANAQGLQAPADYLTTLWLPGAELADIRCFDLNGRPAVSARAAARLDGVPTEVRLLAVRWGQDMMFRFVFGYPAHISATLDQQYRQVAFSLARAGPEAQRLRPYRLRVITVAPGETVAQIAARLPFPDFREDRLRVLNGWPARFEPRPGSRVKIVE